MPSESRHGRTLSGLLAVGALSVLAGLSWHSVFGWGAISLKVTIAALLPVAVAVGCRRIGPRNGLLSIVVSIVALLWYLAVFVLHDSLALVIPSGAAPHDLAHSLQSGWAGILSVPLPVAPLGEYLAVPVALVWIGSAFGVEIVYRTNWTLAAAIPPALAYGLGLLFGVGGPGPRDLVAAAFLAIVLLLAGVSVTPFLAANRSGKSNSKRLIAEIAGCSLALVVASACLGPSLPFVKSGNPYDPRTSRIPPAISATTLNPLDDLSQLALDRPQVLMTVHTSHPELLRLAVLDQYNPVDGWTASSRFEVVGTNISTSGAGQKISEMVSLERPEGPWLPAAVRATQVTGVQAYVDPSTGVLVAPGGVRRRTYRIVARIPTSYEDVATPNCRLDAAEPPPSNIDIPGPIAQLAQQDTSTATSPCQRAQDLVLALRNFNFDAKAPSGSNIQILQNFLTGPTSNGGQNGTEEQFAGAFALMADSLSMDARVVVGYYPGKKVATDEYQVGPQDATAWVEIHFDGAGWIPFFPKPLKGGTPPNQQTDQQKTTPKPVPSPTGAGNNNGPVREALPAPPAKGANALEVAVIVLAIVLGAVTLLVLLSAGTIAAYRKRVRSRRRNDSDVRRRVVGAWSQARDTLEDIGVKHREADTVEELIAVGVERLGAPVSPSLDPLGHLCNAVRYSELEFEVRDAEEAWQWSDQVADIASGSLSVRDRVRRALDITVLFRRRHRS